MADYLRERFAGKRLPAELARVINRRTEGNPLFMVSVVDDLVARGLIAMRERRWELRAALEEVEVGVPESLRQMIERRLGQLDPEEQRILAAGSVAGMEFSAASVAAALGRTALEIEERCDELARRQLFIRSLGAREWPDRTVASRYGFIHALHRNALVPGHLARRGGAPCTRRSASGRRSATATARGTSPPGWPRTSSKRATIAAPCATCAQAAETATAPTRQSRGGRLCRARARHRRAASRTASASTRGSRSSSSSGWPAAPWATCAPRSRTSRRAPATRGSTAARAEEARALLELGGALSWIDRDRSLAAVEQALALAPRLRDEALQAHVRGSYGVPAHSVRAGGATRMPRRAGWPSTPCGARVSAGI